MERDRLSESEVLDLGMSEWFLTYGDLMSLLLCFFIMLYAMSTLQVSKMQAAVESFRGSSAKQEQGKQQEQNTKTTTQTIQKTVQTTTQKTIQTTIQKTYSDAKSIEGGIICFQANSDELSEDAKRQLNLLIEDIDGLPFKIQITGHAEANEQGTYRDSIDLSYSRAVNVCRYFVSKGMNQNDFRIYAAGFSEPVEAEGIDLRKINTCVDIKIIANAVRNNEQKEQNKTGKELKYLKF